MNLILRFCLLLSCLLGMGAEAATHTVARGEHLEQIAGKFGTTWPQVAKQNAKLIKNPNHIEVGWVLTIPDAQVASTAALLPAAQIAVPAVQTATVTKVTGIGCATAMEHVSAQERIVNDNNCARIAQRAVRAHVATSLTRVAYEPKSHIARTEIARPARASLYRTEDTSPPMPDMPVPDPVIAQMIDNELAEIKAGLEDITGPADNLTPLAWVILLKRHGIMPNPRVAELSLSTTTEPSSLLFERLKE